jgi:hypothetical protein
MFVALGLALVLAFHFALRLGTLQGLWVAGMCGLYAASLLLSLSALWLFFRVPARRRAPTLWPLLLFVLLSCLREGALGSRLSFDLNYSTTWRTIRSDAINSKEGTTSGAGLRLSDLDLILDPVQVSPGGKQIHDGFVEIFRAHNINTKNPDATVNVTLNAHDVACYTPLFKKATFPFDVSVHISWRTEGFAGSGVITVKGQITQSTLGIASCRDFNRAVGVTIENIVAKQINGFL